jgi:hypothetical protein
MPPRRRTPKDTPAKLAKRMPPWRVVLLRAKGEILGTVEAPDVAAAKASAAIQFELDEIQRNRIMDAGVGVRGIPPASNGTGIRCGTLNRCFEVVRVSSLSLRSLLVYRCWRKQPNQRR